MASNDIVYELRDRGLRAFRLRTIVALVWGVVLLQEEAVERWGVAGPFELTVALRDVRGATLGHLGEGWAEPDYGSFDPTFALDEHVLLRAEVDGPLDAQALAFDVADRVELAFGGVGRRYLANRGPFEGRFDPR